FTLFGAGERVATHGVALETGRLMPYAERLQRHRCQNAPSRRGPHLIGEPLGVGEVPPKPRLQPRHALLANQEPELERPEAASERQTPVPEILHLSVRR